MTDAYLNRVTLSLKSHDTGVTNPSHANGNCFCRSIRSARTEKTRMQLASAVARIARRTTSWDSGFTRFWPSVGTVAAIGLSFAFMAVALKSIPFGTAYAIWCGIGVAGSAMVGIIAFGEPRTSLRLLCLMLIATGIVGLKLASP